MRFKSAMRQFSSKRGLQVLAGGTIALTVLPGCTREFKFSPVDMWNRSRLKPYEPVAFFDDQLSSRPKVPGTIARGNLQTDDAVFRGTQNDRFVTAIPAAARGNFSERDFILRGQERYNIYCSMCHGAAGHGDGMVVQRGFSPPPDYRIARLRNAPVGHFYDVIANGYGAMYSYSSRVPVRDRWAIAAYIRELQRVQPEVVEDIRYRKDGSRMDGNSGMSGAGANRTNNTIGTGDNSGSSSQVRQGGREPGPKNPTQALPQQPSAQATPGLQER